MYYCKKKNRKCRYSYHIIRWVCRTCVEQNLGQCPITCDDCRFDSPICRGKYKRRTKPCDKFEWD